MNDKLDLRAEKAIRNYIAKLFIVPSVIVAIAAFFLGYFINTVAHKEAKITAYEKFQTVQSKTEDKFHEMVAKLYNEIDGTRQKIYKAENDINHSIKETSKLLTSAEKLQLKVSSLDVILKSGQISSSIATDPSFIKSVTNELSKANELSNKVKIVSENNQHCIITEYYQICWGQKTLEAKDQHYRTFYFKFPEKFKSDPVVTNGINAKGSGYAFSIYSHFINKEYYDGNIVEVEKRKTNVPVTMNYIAISKN